MNQQTQQEVSNEVPQPISKLPKESQEMVLGQVLRQLASSYAGQDYVREIRVHPDDVEFIKAWLAPLGLPEIVEKLLTVVPNDGSAVDPGYIVQSQIETEWLTRHFKDNGLHKRMSEDGAPLLLNHRDLKLLYLLDALKDCDSQRRRLVTLK